MSQETLSNLLDNAYRALERGDKLETRHWAELAADAFPEREEPWLILAGIAAPRASLAYLEKALQINPQNERTRQGMAWAKSRIKEEEPAAPGHAGSSQGFIPHQEPPPQKKVEAPSPLHFDAPQTVSQPPRQPPPEARSLADTSPHRAFQAKAPEKPPILNEKALAKRRHSLLPLLALVACASIAWALLPGNVSPALAFLNPNKNETLSTSTLPGGAAEIAKPTYTPTSTATPSPTPTFTPTFTPTHTPTSTPTNTPAPTPLPSRTPQLPTPRPIDQTPGVNGERWIDVDLSEQVVYAYEGETIVASFIVSTGTWKHPTVTGQYYIYVKYRYSDMSGPGYYLRDVPYTMYFYKGYALHGTYWHSNFGTRMSHGCINLRTEDAEWLFSFASIGTLVNIHQ